VILWEMLWENLGSAIYVDKHFICATYLNIFADQVHPFMTMVFHGGSGLF